jgi:hypothetical protein
MTVSDAVAWLVWLAEQAEEFACDVASALGQSCSVIADLADTVESWLKKAGMDEVAHKPLSLNLLSSLCLLIVVPQMWT